MENGAANTEVLPRNNGNRGKPRRREDETRIFGTMIRRERQQRRIFRQSRNLRCYLQDPLKGRPNMGSWEPIEASRVHAHFTFTFTAGSLMTLGAGRQGSAPWKLEECQKRRGWQMARGDIQDATCSRHSLHWKYSR